jgi:hypothetical protein
MANPIYTYKGKSYEILSDVTDKDDKGRANQLLIDFKHCESIGDWNTLKNRINGGLHNGWLREVDYVIGDNKTHYKDKWERGKEEGFNKEVDEEGFW